MRAAFYYLVKGYTRHGLMHFVRWSIFCSLENNGPGLNQFGRLTPNFFRPTNRIDFFVYKVPPNGIVNVIIDAKDDIIYTSVSFLVSYCYDRNFLYNT